MRKILLLLICVFLLAFTPIEFEGNEITLKNTYLDPTWTHINFKNSFSSVPVVFMVIDSYGSNSASVRIKNVTRTGFDVSIVEPQGEDGPHFSQTLNYFAINKGVHKLGSHYIEVGTVDTKKVQGRFAPSGNDVGWTKLNLENSFTNPAVVANIQTLNNLESGSNPPSTPLIPWATAVVENNQSGIYVALDMSETSEGVFDNNETIGYMVADGNFTDSFIDNSGKVIKYETIKTGRYFQGWNNGCKTVDFQNTYTQTPLIAGWKNSRFGRDGGWFRRCYLDNTKIGFVVDEDQAHDSERSHIKETGGIFAFSDSFDIGAFMKHSTFNAVDYISDTTQCNAVNDWDDNITTKLVNKEFNLTVLAKNPDTDTPLEANITKVTLYYYDSSSNGECSGDLIGSKVICNNCGQTNINGCMTLDNSNLNVDRAVKCVEVNIQGRALSNTSSEVNESNSSDNFAVRPYKFIITDIPSNIKAGNDFNITLKAVDKSGNPVKDYNETVYVNGQSVDLEYNETKSGCKTGILNKVSGGNFVNGEANITLNYNEVGDLNLTVKEINGSEYANIDSDDTSDTQRFIQSVSGELNFTADHFELSGLFQNYDKEGNFTYYDRDLNISSKLELNITAVDKNGNVLSNYNKDCYAKNILINIQHNSVDVNVSKIIYKYINTNNTEYDGNVSKDENVTFVYDKNNFTADNNGTASVDVYFNFDRNSSVPLNPFEFNLTNIEVNDTDANGTLSLNESTKYYYGNLPLNDVLAVENDFNQSYSFAVYDENDSDVLKPGGKEIIYHWYENTDHKVFDGNVTDSEITVSRDYNASDVLNGVNVSVGDIDNGKIEFKINRTDSSVNFAVVHLLSPNLKWLWYSRFSQKYDISPASSCLNHFCFALTWQSNENGEVGSGDFSGTESNITDSNVTKRGVKIFR